MIVYNLDSDSAFGLGIVVDVSDSAIASRKESRNGGKRKCIFKLHLSSSININANKI
jgi:hypothetical protein